MWKSTKWKYKNEILYVHYAVFFIFYAVFLAVTAWRYADDAGEHSREVVVVVKADFVAYLVDAHLCVDKHSAGLFNLQPVVIGERTVAGLVFEHCREVS